jgi:transposase
MDATKFEIDFVEVAMKVLPSRRYTAEFRQAAVQQVLEGKRPINEVARSLEMSLKTLHNWVGRARAGVALSKRKSDRPISELQAENARLRQENERLKLEKEILKKAAAYFAKEST